MFCNNLISPFPYEQKIIQIPFCQFRTGPDACFVDTDGTDVETAVFEKQYSAFF
jgi:hypothetical protein